MRERKRVYRVAHITEQQAYYRIWRAKQLSEYFIWKCMIQRCTDQKHKSFKDYGGRGITVCDRWRNSFDAFLADMGPRPSPKHSIDRIKNDGNYEPGNCRWATAKEQNNNKRPRQKVAAGSPSE